MALDDLRETFNTVRPHTNGLISRSRHSRVTVRCYAYAMDWAFVSNEAERTHHRFEVPNHNSSVDRSGNDLSEVGIKAGRCNAIFVSFERTLEGGICYTLLCAGASD